MKPVKQIFLELIDLPPQEQEERLAARCGGDAQLREMVRSLLNADDLGQQDVHGPTVEITRRECAAGDAHGPPREIGPYRVLRQIGEGGFAKVYLAEQVSPVRRRVALKVLKPGMDTGRVVARFDAERQALAMMNHAHVAKVFDAGVTEGGRPYFVMEYVPGESITAFCDRHRLTIRRRLELFCQACAAVHHAHQKAIIHRDLKPSNILVTMEDDAPQVKVIDFGVAKALSQPLTESTLFTGSGQLIGTPEYMSPEQADMSAFDVDTRSDVYSLGVVLYELLAGALPFDSSTLRSSGYNGIQRTLREVEPPRPSARLRTIAERAVDVARKRQTQPATLEKELRTELEWIPLKAMRKERDRRYASALQLGEDIQNYLNSRPLIAAPESTVYRLRKLARRNRGAIAAASALLLALLLGIVTTSVMYVRSEHQRREAQRQQRIAQARFDDVRTLANTFLFDVHDQIEQLPGATAARAALVHTALEYLQKLSVQAGDDTDLLREILAAYIRVGDIQGNPASANLGDSAGALDSYRNALEIAGKLAAADVADVSSQRTLATIHQKIGEMLLANGDTDGAMNYYRMALDNRRRLADAEPANASLQRDLMLSHGGMGKILVAGANTSGALESYRAALAIAQKLVHADPDDVVLQRDLMASHTHVGDMLAATGDRSAALEHFRTVLDITQKLAESNPNNAKIRRALSVSHNRIGDMLVASGDTGAALVHYRKSLGIRRELADADPTDARAQRDVLVSHERIGAMLAAAGDMSGAMESFSRVVEIAQKLSDADPANANLRRDLSLGHLAIGDRLAAAGNTAAALDSYRKSMGIAQELAGADPSNANAQRDVAVRHGRIAGMLAARGDPTGALESYRASITIAQKLADADPTNAKVQLDLSISHLNMGDVLATGGDTSAALKSYGDAVAIAENLAVSDPTSAHAQRHLLVCYSRMGGTLEGLAKDETKTPREQIELWRQARAWYLREVEQVELLEQRNLLSPTDAMVAAERRGDAARCDAAIAELTAAIAPPATNSVTVAGGDR